MIIHPQLTALYENLGVLFYAIAADQRISIIEVGELKLLINKEWVSNADNGISDAAHTIILTLDGQYLENVKPAEAFNSFASYYNVHQGLFTSPLKKNILQTASKIISVFSKSKHINDSFRQLTALFDGVPANS